MISDGFDLPLNRVSICVVSFAMNRTAEMLVVQFIDFKDAGHQVINITDVNNFAEPCNQQFDRIPGVESIGTGDSSSIWTVFRQSTSTE